MPNRLIKESIHTSEKINRLSDFQFRLWVGLLTYVDDYGRGDARIPVIKGTVFPLRERITSKDIDAALNALAGAGCITLYQIDGRPYLCFPTWESHQTVRNKKSRYPAPQADVCNPQTIESNCMQLKSNVPVIQSESESESEEEVGRAARFTPPSTDDVSAYCRENGIEVDAQRFCDYYTANGWKVGRSPMKDWRAAVRNWSRNEYGAGHPQHPPDYQRRKYTAEDFRGMETDLSAELAEIRTG